MLVTRSMRMPQPRPSRRARRDDDQGSTLISVVVVALVLGLLTVTLSQAVVNTATMTTSAEQDLQSQAAADAGMAAAIVAARAAEDVCADVAVAPGSLPGGASYTATISCAADASTTTLTATGTADGTSTTATATYNLVAETEEVADPTVTPVGLVLYEAAEMGQVTLQGTPGTTPQIVVPNGDFRCRLTVPGNVTVAGNVTSSDSCDIRGNLWAGGTIDFSGGATTVLGDVTAAGTGLSKINSAIGSTDPNAPRSTIRTGGSLDLLWSRARTHANVISRGDVTVNDRVISGSVTLPTGRLVSINGGRIEGGTTRSSAIPAVAKPSLPGWYDYRYKVSDWPGATVITLRNVNANATDTCAYYNAWTGWDVRGTYVGGGNRGWSDLADRTGTVVIDGRACDMLTTNAGGNPAPALRANNVVLLAKKFNLTGLKMTSATGASPKVWFITEDTVADGKPTCAAGSNAVNFEVNGANLDGVRSMIYTPCIVGSYGGGVVRGAMYSRGFQSGGQITIKAEHTGLPGQPLPDGSGGSSGGGSAVETGRHTLGTLSSRRDLG